MQSFKDSLAFWSGILGTVLSVLGLSESSRWLASFGFLLAAVSITSLLYANRQRVRLKSASVKLEGRSIDSLNVASLGRRLNRSLVVQEADQVATIKGEDMVVTWRYSGYCRASHESAVEFSIDADNHIPFNRLECYAYDLRNDPTGNTESGRSCSDQTASRRKLPCRCWRASQRGNRSASS